MSDPKAAKAAAKALRLYNNVWSIKYFAIAIGSIMVLFAIYHWSSFNNGIKDRPVYSVYHLLGYQLDSRFNQSGPYKSRQRCQTIWLVCVLDTSYPHGLETDKHQQKDFSRKLGAFGLLGLEEYAPRTLDSHILRKAPPVTQGCRLHLHLHKRLAWHSVPICLVTE
ncbi:hypothetical protein ACN42_g6295 [Penicillium freii]|uniref:Uncharacterized protein n=1 Tax=Penicillium freii TaxID=48697 RepID=A0A124GRD0_PENFR|nr:hypothetical protein ACN42_g6295 [Penicillium freii]